MEDQAADLNLFMVCNKLDHTALSDLPPHYRFRYCQPEDLPLWKSIHFDDPALALAQRPYMDAYFERVYAPHGQAFFKRCLLVCDSAGTVAGTCFAWPAYGQISTIHWFKVLKSFEGRGIGRALLSKVVLGIAPKDYPVCLHTQPGSYRAIKLYSDFGFCLITDACVGQRRNGLEQGLAYLQARMPKNEFERLCYTQAPQALLQYAAAAPHDEF